jgi:hypothetical protein
LEGFSGDGKETSQGHGKIGKKRIFQLKINVIEGGDFFLFHFFKLFKVSSIKIYS